MNTSKLLYILEICFIFLKEIHESNILRSTVMCFSKKSSRGAGKLHLTSLLSLICWKVKTGEEIWEGKKTKIKQTSSTSFSLLTGKYIFSRDTVLILKTILTHEIIKDCC